MRHASGVYGAGEIPLSICQKTSAGLYATHEYPEFVPTVTIKWEELAGLVVLIGLFQRAVLTVAGELMIYPIHYRTISLRRFSGGWTVP